MELAHHRIRVNLVHPGWIDTPGERKFFSEETLKEQGHNCRGDDWGGPKKSVEASLSCATRETIM